MTSQVILRNDTDEQLRLAIYKKPVKNPNLTTIAWRIAELPPRGKQRIKLPASYEIFADYGTEANPSQTDIQTGTLTFNELTARFNIDSASSQDNQSTGAVINQSFSDLVMNEVRVTNNFDRGVRLTIAKDGDAIYEPQIVSPGGLFLEDIRASLYVAVVNEFTFKGSRLVQEEFATGEAEVLEGGTLVAKGSMWRGYSVEAE